MLSFYAIFLYMLIIMLRFLKRMFTCSKCQKNESRRKKLGRKTLKRKTRRRKLKGG